VSVSSLVPRASLLQHTSPTMSIVNADGDFERKDEIRHRLRGILRLTSSKQKLRLLCGHVGLVKKGFHCRTREELQAVDEYLRKHFPQQMTAGVQISAAAMEEKLLSIERTTGIGECAFPSCTAGGACGLKGGGVVKLVSARFTWLFESWSRSHAGRACCVHDCSEANCVALYTAVDTGKHVQLTSLSRGWHSAVCDQRDEPPYFETFFFVRRLFNRLLVCRCAAQCSKRRTTLDPAAPTLAPHLAALTARTTAAR
jgi:hypothetical protein